VSSLLSLSVLCARTRHPALHLCETCSPLSRAGIATQHSCNVSAGEPCLADCGISPRSCSNRPLEGVTACGRVKWLAPPGRGLLLVANVPEGAFVANFGVLVDAHTRPRAKFVLRVRVGRSDEDEGGSWSRPTSLVAPAHEDAPRSALEQAFVINHTCCERHRNCEFVVPERQAKRPFTVWVRTTRTVTASKEFPVELLTDYGDLVQTVVPACSCCKCTGMCA